MTPAGAEMTETRVIVACAERQVHWYLGAEPAKCTDPDHQHRQAEVHRHRRGITTTSTGQTSASPPTRAWSSPR
jgi:hypothetical protein